MSATVGAALKKMAVALFTNPKVLKTVLGIVLGIVIALITPILAVIAVFNGGIKLDTEKLLQIRLCCSRWRIPCTPLRMR